MKKLIMLIFFVLMVSPLQAQGNMGTISGGGNSMTVAGAVAVWKPDINFLHIILTPFEPTAEETKKIAEGWPVNWLRKDASWAQATWIAELNADGSEYTHSINFFNLFGESSNVFFTNTQPLRNASFGYDGQTVTIRSQGSGTYENKTATWDINVVAKVVK